MSYNCTNRLSEVMTYHPDRNRKKNEMRGGGCLGMENGVRIIRALSAIWLIDNGLIIGNGTRRF